MVTKRGFNKETIAKLFSGKVGLVRNIFNPMYAFADGAGDPPAGDPPSGDPPSGDPPKTVNYEDLIAKARKEEKDKLYPKITALEGERDSWIKKCNEHLITIGTKEAEIESLNKKLKESGKDDSETVKALKADILKLQGEVEEAKKNVPDVKAIEDKIKAEYEVKLYRETKLREAGETVIPELVTGTTKEEIDTTLAASQKRFKEMSEKILGGNGSFVPPANASTSKMDFNKFTMEDLAKLDPKSAEYKEFRKKLGLK